MKKYSFSYNGINPNFVISDFGTSKEIDKTLSGMLDILSNILMRGMPTIASKYLADTVGESSIYNDTVYSFNDKDLSWDTIIKGGTTNPAISFYNFLKNRLKSYYAYFLPECPTEDILTFANDDKNLKVISNSSVDFYSPFYKTAIEIDGSQHNQSAQKNIDNIKDNRLNIAGCKIYRISTTCSKSDRVAILNSLINDIKKIISENFNRFIIDYNNISDIDMQYMIISRIQVCLIELFRSGILDINRECYTIKIVSDNCSGITNAAEIAYNDIKIWLENLYRLNGESLVFPDIEFTIDDSVLSCLTIDIDCLSRYDENIFSNSDKYIYIRNDYFAYNRFASSEVSIYIHSKNYYHTYSNNFRFNRINATDDNKIEALEFFLKNIFDFDNFRPKQIEIIASALNPDNGTVGLLPTGSGKSICYQLAGILTPGITMVVAPLTVLMKDQCDNLYTRNHINAYVINSDKSNFNDIINNNIVEHENGANIKLVSCAKTIYISPERFFNEDFLLKFNDIVRILGEIVVDEVHCLSEWGHDFRTSYLMLFKFIRSANVGARTLLIGTSATSSPRVTNDIVKEFESIKERANVVKGQSLKRKELTFEVIKGTPIYLKQNNKYEDGSFNSAMNIAKTIYKKDAESGKKLLIFSAYAKNVNIIQMILQQDNVYNNYPVNTYASKDKNVKNREEIKTFNQKKEETYNNFKNNQGCLIATKAFGMGVDIPDIRQTIHIDMSSSVESMYQEMGRAGRDGKPSTCTVIYCSTPEIESKISELENSDNASLDNIDCNKYGPLNKQLFLMYTNNYSPEKEAAFILDKIIPFLKKCNGSFSLTSIKDESGEPDCNKSVKASLEAYMKIVDQSLYKLFILGIIPLWTLKYGSNVYNPVYSGIDVNINIEEAIYNLEKYIQQFNFNYKFEKEKTLNNVVFEICKWNYDNYVVYHFKSLFTLHEMVASFTDSDSFMQRIENYFSDSSTLDKIITNPDDMQWINSILLDPLVLHDQLQKYVADYSMNPIVRYLDGLTSLRLAKFNKEKVQDRYIDNMIAGIRYLSSINNNVVSDILKKTFYSISVESSKEIVDILFNVFNKEMINDSWQLKTELNKLNIISINEFDAVVECYSIRDSLLKLKSALQKCDYKKG